MPKVLLVEDSEESRDGLARHLRRKGFEILLAVDGRQGLDMARAGAPDLVLMDMSLPVLDGWEATRQLKAAPETRRIPVIALTAHAMAGDREKSSGGWLRRLRHQACGICPLAGEDSVPVGQKNGAGRGRGPRLSELHESAAIAVPAARPSDTAQGIRTLDSQERPRERR
jgi:two-component system, cell cycle response regulator DivK